MTRLTQTRRRFLAAGSGTVLAGLVGGTKTLAQEGGWRSVDVPGGEALTDVVLTSRGPYAVGQGGVVLARRADGWEAVLERGPTVQSNGLRAAGVTDDGDQIWFAGDSGVVGRYDVVDEELTDHSAPEIELEDGSTSQKTSTWEGVAVTDETGSETVHLVNGSGEYLQGTLTDEGGVDWGQVVEPGGGSSAFGIDFLNAETGYIADTSSQVYETTDGGESWTEIGVSGASEAFQDVAAVSESEVDVAAGNGVVYRYDGANWSEVSLGESTVEAIDRVEDRGLASGAGGSVYEYDGSEWTTVETPVETTLSGIALGSDGFPDAAVGASATVIERGEYTGEAAPDATTGEWTTVETPVDTTLTGVTRSSRGPYAVGDGVVLTRRADGWESAIERFPATEPATLTDVAATDDGDRVWFVGSSGVVGRYDVTEYRLTDHSAPEVELEDGSTSQKTSTWEGVAVTGETGSETVHLVNGSGEYLQGTLTEAGGVDWGQVIEPGGGSSAFGIDFIDAETGYIADTTSQVYETTDGGESWETIGVDGGSATYTDVVARSPEEIYVAAGDGTVLRYNGAVWTKRWAGGNELLGADATEDDAAFSGAGGTIYEETPRGLRAASVDAQNALEDVGLDDTGNYPHAAVGASGLAVESGEYTADAVSDDESPSAWEAVEAPVEVVFYDVVQAGNAYAVGEGGTVIERAGGEWSVVLEDGPAGANDTLNGVAATDDGDRVWFAGASGALGEYDADGEVTNHSAPMGMTSTWESVAVTGDAGSETIHLVNGSGEYLQGTRGSDGSVEWGQTIEPGGGSSALGVDFLDAETGYVVDTTSQVYETTDGGESWETIGVSGGSSAYTGVSARSPQEIYVSAGNGTVLRYNGAVWTAHWAGGDELNAVDAGSETVVVAGNAGTVVERTTRRWASAETSTDATIYGAALSDGGPNPGIVVGNPGTILERVDDPDGSDGSDGSEDDDGGDGDGSDDGGDGDGSDDGSGDGGDGDGSDDGSGDGGDGDGSDDGSSDDGSDGDGSDGSDDGSDGDDSDGSTDDGSGDDGSSDDGSGDDGSDGGDEGDSGGDSGSDGGDSEGSDDGDSDGDGDGSDDSGSDGSEDGDSGGDDSDGSDEGASDGSDDGDSSSDDSDGSDDEDSDDSDGSSDDGSDGSDDSDSSDDGDSDGSDEDADDGSGDSDSGESDDGDSDDSSSDDGDDSDDTGDADGSDTGSDDSDGSDAGDADDSDGSDGADGSDEDSDEADGSGGSEGDDSDGSDDSDDAGDGSGGTDDGSDGSDDDGGSDDSDGTSGDGSDTGESGDGPNTDGSDDDGSDTADGSGDSDGTDEADDTDESSDAGGDGSSGDGADGSGDGDVDSDASEGDADDSDASDDPAAGLSLSGSGVDADGTGRYEITNDGESASSVTLVVAGRVVERTRVGAGETVSITLADVGTSTVVLCLDGREIDRVRAADC